MASFMMGALSGSKRWLKIGLWRMTQAEGVPGSGPAVLVSNGWLTVSL